MCGRTYRWSSQGGGDPRALPSTPTYLLNWRQSYDCGGRVGKAYGPGTHTRAVEDCVSTAVDKRG